MQALQIMERQVGRLEHYPEMEAALRRHIEEIHGQRDRLEEALRATSGAPSPLKEGFLGLVGNMMALGHVLATDEILKTPTPIMGLKKSDIAAYISLLAIAEGAGYSAHLVALQQSCGKSKRWPRRLPNSSIRRPCAT